ncbi:MULTISPECIES: hemagglutinin repeat-containing protein [Burkholderiaceae]|uniref:two-partner secretion domain-containing protein n=1 Tax=Burkholderiaceae TaxID=119060 RepID=UPI000962F707|nr:MULTISPECIES: hemagglutinin repeat-containing protein [Burkholderiaceae]MCG1018703.1 hemagglutinin repeat-containing protein [Mycetohabitans sp. B4]SIT75240.1 filamentous hemagglutinin [Burkholderia sp. b13]
MNSHLYRVIFNRARGLQMAVAEHVASQRKQRGVRAARSACSLLATMRALDFSILVSLGMVVDLAQAQIVADPGAPRDQQPTVLNAANGVPLINIQAPSASGVSRNTYRQFDVDHRGVILNNASTHAQTQLGGWVQGNPWLVNGTARVILNEINASHPSQLRGYMEVAGERAQVVVANPAGISCDGCGFINANRVTLTTGAPIMNGGNLDGYRVQQGAVTIAGGGLDASRADYTDIIARSVQINAGLWAQQLRVTTGVNQVSASQSVVDPITTDSNVPAFALDVSQLGGMYAQKIVLLGTEHGVGMRNAGQIGASAGELVVTADGRLENSGALQARTNTRLDVGGGVANSGTISAGRELVLYTPKDLDNRGGTLNAMRLEVNADSVTNRGGTIEQTGAQDLVVHAAQVRNREDGRIGQAGADADAATMPGHDGTSGINISGDSDAAPLAAGALNVTHILDNDGGRIMAKSAIDLTARAGLDNEGGHLGVRDLNVKDGDLVNRLGELYVTGSHQLQLGALQNEKGQMQLAGPLTLNAQSFDNRAGQLVVAGGDNRLEVMDELDNSRGGQIVSDGALHIRASTLKNAQGRVQHAGGGRLQIEVPQFEGVGGTLTSDGVLTLTSHRADLRGGLTQAKQIHVDTDTLITAEGVLRSSGAGMLELKVRDVLDNTHGAIRGNGALTLQAQQLTNERGRISAAGTHDTQVDIADQLNNINGQLVAAGNATVQARDLRNQGGMIRTKGQSNLNVSVGGTLDNRAQGTLAADGDLSVTASTVDNRRGKLIGAHGLRVTSTTLDNREDGLVSATEGHLKVDSQGHTHNAGGTLQAAGELTLDSTGLDNTDGAIRGSQVKLDTRQATLNNTGGTLMSTAGRLDVSSGALDNTGGLVQSCGAMRVQTHGQTVRNIDSGKTGGIFSGGELDLNSGELHNRAGVVHSQGQLTAHVGALNNTQGQFGGSAEVGLKADSLRNRGGVIQAGQALQMGVADVTDNDGGLIAASGELSLNAKRIYNRDTRSTDPGTPLGLRGDAVALTAKHIDNHAGTITANRRVEITGAGTDSVLDNTQGNVSSAGSIQVFADHVYNPAGTLLSGTDLRVEAESLRGAGHLLSKGNLNLALQQDFDNENEVTANGHAVIRTPGRLVNRGTFEADELEVRGAQIDNTVGGRINGNRVGVATDGKLSNHGLIDGAQTRIEAGVVDNIGTGRLYGDHLTLQANTVDNRQEDGQAAVIAARTRLDIDASRLSGAGRLLSDGDLNLALQQDFDNENEVMANGHAVVRTEGQLTNRGVLQAGELEVHGAQIDNTVGGRINGNRVWVATGGKLSNRGLIDGVQTRIGASAVDNVGTGRLYGDHLTLQANTVDNRQEDGQAAVIAARARLDIGASKLSGAGRLLSNGDLNLALQQDFDNDHEVIANGHAVIRTGGQLTNRGVFQAGELEVRGAQIDNTVDGRINGNRVWVATDGKLSNRGLIDGVQTRVEADAVDNVGTGRFYGDHLALQANTIDNRQEHGRAAVIAARTQLDIGANVVNNHEQALIFSAGHDSTALNIAGALNEQGQAVDRAAHVLNDSATIESLGGLSFNTQHLLNRNAHFATELVQVSGPTQSIALQPAGDPNKHDINDYHWAGGHKSGCYFHNGTGAEISNWTQYDITRTEYETRVTQSAPALIRSGGNLVLHGENFTNDKSHIFVGGTLQGDLGNLKNEAVFGQHITREVGTSQYTWNEWRGGLKRRHDRHWEARIAYTPADIVHTIELPVSKVEQHTASGVRGYAIEQQQLSQADDALKASEIVEVSAVPSVRAPELGQIDVAISGPDPAISGQGPVIAGQNPVISGQEPTSGQNEQGGLDTHGDAPMVIRTVQPSAQVPANSLFRVQPNNGSYLIETDPRFTDYRTWQSAATLLSQGKHNPAATHKRLGDGFYEQMLVREQVAQLTGRRFLKGYASDEAQYQALLEAGSAYAKAWNLRPGVALSAQQMAQLTRDIVWLVEQDVHLPDGTVTRALVPQVYARVKPGDLDGNGTLLAAESIDMRLKDELVNTGTLAGHTAVQLNAENLRNVGGRITGKTVSAQALGDIDIIGGSIDADQALFVQAGRDLNMVTTTRSDAKQAGQSDFSRTHLDRIAGLSVNYPLGGPLAASAGRDVNLIAAQIANNGQNGQTALIAGRNLSLVTVKVAEQERNVIDASNYLKQGIEQEVGTTVHARGDVRMQAGGDLNARAARVNSDQGTLVALADGDVNIVGGQTSRHWSEGRQYKSRNLFGSSQTTTRDSLVDTTAQASIFSGHTVAVQGRNVTLTGSNVVSDKGTFIEAQNDLTIQAATQTYSESHFKETKKRGLLHNGAMSVTIGSQAHSADQQEAGTRAMASTVGSTNGNVTLAAKQLYRQEGSHILTPRGDVDIQAGEVIITEAREQSQGTQQTQFKQSGLTVAVTAPAMAAVQTAQQMERSVGQTSDPRMQALAGVTTGLAVKNTADAIAQDPKSGGGVNISVTVGGAQSGSQATYNRATASGSSIAAGGNVRVQAIGPGQDSTLTVQGSEIQGGGDVQLKADGKINLLAAQNARESHLTHSSLSGGAGVAVNLNSQGKTAGVTANVSGARGWGEGTDVNWTPTHLSAGNRLVLESGGDTTLKGAVLSGRQVIGEVGGDLHLESLQERSSERSRDMSLGGSVTAGLGVSGSVSFSQQKIASDWASVTERSGIQAGDGGFQINVKDHTSLKGAAIASTQQAVHDGANSLTTRTLSTEDIVNYAEYNASSVGLSGGYSVGGSGGGEDLEGVGTNQSGQAATGAEQVPGSKLPSTPGGFSVAPPSVMAASGKASSTTLSGISTGTIRITDEAQQKALTGRDVAQSLAGLNQQVRSGQDGDNALKPIFDKEKIQAGFEIANQLTHQIGTFVGHRQAQLDEAQQAAQDPNLSAQARAQAQQQAAQLKAQWGPGGTYRRALSALGAAAGGNVTAGAGQFALSATVNYVQGLAASEVKRVADGLRSEEARAALHALVGCAGAAASRQDCGAGAMGAAASSMLGSLLGPTQGLTQRQKEAQTNLVSSLVAAVAGMAGQDTPTATTAAVTKGRFNRQINDNEKRAIAEKADSNKAEQERLVKAACYAVKCWAEYKPGSEEYTKRYVSQLEASQLQPEIDWVNQQKEAGLFEYTSGQKIGDAVKSDPVGVVKDVAKVVAGGVTAKTGATICATTGVGCVAGVSMISFGISDMVEGGVGLYNRYNGTDAQGINPLRWGFTQISPIWGNTVYDALNFGTAALALRASVPLRIGVADGLNRPSSMFNVTVPRINNPILNPFTHMPLPYGVTQGTLLFGVGSKGGAVVNDIRHAGEGK